MPVMKPMVFPLLAAAIFLSGCATWYSQTPDGIRHTRMMVNSEQEYAYYVDPVERPAAVVAVETPFDRLKRLFSRSTD
jgi:hypothetical protein